MIEELPHVLSWQGSAAFCHRRYKNYVNHLGSALGCVLGRIVQIDPAQGNQLLKNIHCLPDIAVMRILTAPETCSKVLHGTVEHHLDDTIIFLSQAIDAEYRRFGKKITASREAWTALGDYCFSQASPRGFHDPTVHDIFESPRLSNDITVDFESPYAKAELAGVSDYYSELTISEMECVVDKLNCAVAGIDAISECAASTLKWFTKTVVVRKDLTCPNEYASSSLYTHIGRTVLVNPQLDRIETVDLADTLIHETIHSLLYVTELEHPFIGDESTASEFPVVSPWTGATLPLHSYLHACFVWYGLWRFWSMAIRSGVFREDKIEQRLVKASAGFKKDSLIHAVSHVASAISPSLLRALSAMQGHLAVM